MVVTMCFFGISEACPAPLFPPHTSRRHLPPPPPTHPLSRCPPYNAVDASSLIPIAKPLAYSKLCKKLLKVTKKAAKRKQIRRGVKEVVKALRKGSKGLCLIAGNISPLDVVSHLPVMCEDRDIPYVFVPSKEELGAAGLTKRPTSCMLVLTAPAKGKPEADAEFDEDYKSVTKAVKSIQVVW